MASQELINEVIVTSDETGTQAMTSKANVELKETDNIVTVTPQPASLASQSYGYDSKSGSAYTTASKPRTGDETETALYIVLGILQSCPESAHSVTGRQKNSRSRETTLKRQGRCAILI